MVVDQTSDRTFDRCLSDGFTRMLSVGGRWERFLSHPASDSASDAARARVLPILAQQAAQQVIDSKYGWQKELFALFWRLEGRDQVSIEITQARE